MIKTTCVLTFGVALVVASHAIGQAIEPTEPVMPPAHEAVIATQPPPPAPAAVPVAGAAPAATAVLTSIDLMPLIDLNKVKKEGNWKHPAKSMSVSDTAEAFLQVPYELPDEYNLHIEFSRDSGDGAVTTILARGNHNVSLVMGGLGNTWCGFEKVGGKTMSDGAPGVTSTNIMPNKVKHSLNIKVRKDSVYAGIRGALIPQLITDFSDLEAPELRFAANRITLVTFSPTHFYDIQITPVTGEGKAVDQ